MPQPDAQPGAAIEHKLMTATRGTLFNSLRSFCCCHNKQQQQQRQRQQHQLWQWQRSRLPQMPLAATGAAAGRHRLGTSRFLEAACKLQ